MLILHKHICCDPSSKQSRQDISNEGSQYMANKTNFPLIINEYFLSSRALYVGRLFQQSSAQSLKPETGVKLNHEDINRVLTDVQVMKEKQDNFTTKIDSMKR